MQKIQLWLSSRPDLNSEAADLLSQAGLEFIMVPGKRLEKYGVFTPFIVTEAGVKHYGRNSIRAFCGRSKKESKS